MGQLPYHKLIVWKEAYAFVMAVYLHTETFPKHEQYGLISQLRRASVSVVANIVEGHAKSSKAELIRFLDIARGSLLECAVLLELSRDLHYLSKEHYSKLENIRARTGFLLDKFILGTKSHR